MKLLAYDANRTDGTDASRMLCILENEPGQIFKVPVPETVRFELSKNTIIADGMDKVIVTIQIQREMVTVEIETDATINEIEVPLVNGMGQFAIQSAAPGPITIRCPDEYSIDVDLEAV